MVCLQFVSRHDFAPMWPGPAQSALSDCAVRGVHIRCVLTPAPHRKHSTRCYLNLPDLTRWTRASMCLLLPVCSPLKEMLWTLIRARQSLLQGRPLFYMIRGVLLQTMPLSILQRFDKTLTLTNLWPSVMNGNMIKRRWAQRGLMIYASCYRAHKRDANLDKLASEQISWGIWIE